MNVGGLKKLVGRAYCDFDGDGHYLGCFEPFYLIYENLPLYQPPQAFEEYFLSAMDRILENFYSVPAPEPLDMIVFNLPMGYIHAGVYLGENKFLHVQRNCPYEIQRLSECKKRIRGFFRAKSHLARK